MSVDGYRASKHGGTAERRRLTNAPLLTLIRTIHADVNGAYSSPPVTGEIRSRRFPASKARMAWLTSHIGVRARHKRRHRFTTIPAHKLSVATDVLNPTVKPSGLNQVFRPDIAPIWNDEGSLYRVVTLDLPNSEVVGWSVKTHMLADRATNALTRAWLRRRPATVVL